jgi:hypothetical protein
MFEAKQRSRHAAIPDLHVLQLYCPGWSWVASYIAASATGWIQMDWNMHATAGTDVLRCAMLYCAVLCCAVLCCSVKVERAKKCLDFGSTCYLWHTIFVCCYSGWPKSFAW